MQLFKYLFLTLILIFLSCSGEGKGPFGKTTPKKDPSLLRDFVRKPLNSAESMDNKNNERNDAINKQLRSLDD